MQRDGISPSSRGDNSLPVAGFTQGKLHETRLLLRALRQSGGNPRQPHGTRQRVKLSRGKHSSSLPCQRDGIGDASSSASPGPPALTFPSPTGSMAPISIAPHPTQEGPPQSSFADPPAPKTWETGLPRGRRSPAPSRSSALQHDPPSRRTTPAAPFPKAQPFPEGHQDPSDHPPKTTSIFFPPTPKHW